MKQIAAVMIAVAMLSSCASAPVEIYTKDGQPALYTECPKTIRCHDAARERCGGAYIVVDEQHSSNIVGVPGAFGPIIAPVDKTRLTFRCR